MSQATLSAPITKKSVVLLQEKEMQEVMRLDQTLQECRGQLAAAADQPMLKSFVLARAMNMLRNMLTETMMKDVMQLMGSPLGFRTDRDNSEKGAYTVNQVRDVAIVAMIDGAKFTGNEFNILAGNYYRTKEQLKRRIKEWPGLSDFEHDLQVPSFVEGGSGARVGCRARWKLNGKPFEIDCDATEKQDFRIPVKVNAGMGVDAILGKAERKLFWKVWQRLIGKEAQDWDPSDGDEPLSAEDVIDGTASTKVEVEPLSLESVAARLDMCNSLGQVDALEEEVLSDARCPEEARDTIRDFCFKARERIRNTKSGKGK